MLLTDAPVILTNDKNLLVPNVPIKMLLLKTPTIIRMRVEIEEHLMLTRPQKAMDTRRSVNIE